MKKKRVSMKMRRQKLMGLGMFLLGVGSVFIEWDATAALLICPLGLAMLFTKDQIIY